MEYYRLLWIITNYGLSKDIKINTKFISVKFLIDVYVTVGLKYVFPSLCNVYNVRKTRIFI